ncbi:hypothetical protein ARSEF1564_008148 [Beauveria bassiana]
MTACANLDSQIFWSPSELDKKSARKQTLLKFAEMAQPPISKQNLGSLGLSGELIRASILPQKEMSPSTAEAIYISDNDEPLPMIEESVHSTERAKSNSRFVDQMENGGVERPSNDGLLSRADRPKRSAHAAALSPAESMADSPAGIISSLPSVSVCTGTSVATTSQTESLALEHQRPDPVPLHEEPSVRADLSKLVETCPRHDSARTENVLHSPSDLSRQDKLSDPHTLKQPSHEGEGTVASAQPSERCDAEDTGGVPDIAGHYQATNIEISERGDCQPSDTDQLLRQPGKRQRQRPVHQTPEPSTEDRSVDAASGAAEDDFTSTGDEEPPHKRRKARPTSKKIQPSNDGSALRRSRRLTPPRSDSDEEEAASCGPHLAPAIFDEWSLKDPTLKFTQVDGRTALTIQFDVEDLIMHRSGERIEQHGRNVTSMRNNARPRFTKEEDNFIIDWKNNGYSWKAICEGFNAKFKGQRSQGSIQVRYSTVLQRRSK